MVGVVDVLELLEVLVDDVLLVPKLDEVDRTPMLDEVDNDDGDVDEALVLVTRDASLYISSLFPAPQYSRLLPGHMKLQSPSVARSDPAPSVLPQ